MHPRRWRLWVSLAGFLALAPLEAQTSPATITLAATTSPATAQPGVTVLTLVASSMPAGTITPANLNVTLQVAAGATGPALTAQVSGYGSIPVGGGRITFQVLGPNVTAPTLYLVSVSGQTSNGVAFASGKPAALTINPPAQILSITPSSAAPGQTLQVSITGQYTNYVQGSTTANFGVGISVGGAALGQLGPVTVTSPTTAVAQLTVDPSAAVGVRTVTVATGVQQASLVNGFSILGTPGLLSVNPNTGQQGQAGLSVTITGLLTHFAQGTTTASFGAGITVASLTVNSPTSAMAVLNIDLAAVTGARTVTLTTLGETVSLGNAFTVGAPAGCTPPPPGMIGWWPGDGNASDISGSHTGTPQGGVTFVPGLVGQAFSFDGSTGIVSTPATADLDIRSAITIDAWVSPSKYAGYVAGTCGFAEGCSLIAGRPGGYQLGLYPDGRVAFGFPSGAGGFVNVGVASVTSIPTNTFTSVTGTYDASSGRLAIYINGVLDNTASFSGLIDSGTLPFQIGAFSAPGLPPGYGALTGTIDEVELFNRALSRQKYRPSSLLVHTENVRLPRPCRR